MPEGDTILRTANTMTRAIGGALVERFESRLPALRDAKLDGRRISLIEAKGKHLLIHFDDGRTLASHMGMTGSWHLYRPGERWRKSEGAARAVISTEAFVAVCFSAPKIELLKEREVPGHRSSQLGPDVLAPELDGDAILARLRAYDDVPIGEAVMNQTILAGIGNIYKSESLFSAGISPFDPVRALDDAKLSRLVRIARGLMKASVESNAVSHRAPYYVYLRSDSPCRRCGCTIEMRRQGTAARSTYYCPDCQPRSEGG